MSCEVITTAYADKEIKKLSKRYRSFKEDLKVFRESLKSNPMQGVEIAPNIRKIRMAVSSKGRGKSGGARVITHVQRFGFRAGRQSLPVAYL